jgi:hypothetical protein
MILVSSPATSITGPEAPSQVRIYAGSQVDLPTAIANANSGAGTGKQGDLIISDVTNATIVGSKGMKLSGSPHRRSPRRLRWRWAAAVSRTRLTSVPLALVLLSLAVIPWNARGQAASTPTADATRSVQVAPPSNTASVPDSPAREKSCMKHFPYTPEEFMRKLLLVANEADPYAVPAKFEQAFDVKLHPYGTASPRQFIYKSPESCEWYTQVRVSTSGDLKITAGTRVFLEIGTNEQSLNFGDPHGAQCLSTELVDRALKADGWSGGPVVWEIVTWGYRKGRAKIGFLPGGSTTPDGPRCLNEVTVGYS